MKEIKDEKGLTLEDFLKISPFELTPIPYVKNGFYYDGEKEQPAKHPYYFAGLYYIQEPSVLDTWFSSGLWPIATTIKNHNPNVKNFYPTSVLVTAYDIIFFWVARMLFQCVIISPNSI